MMTRETELAAPIVDWFRQDGWDVYQEVPCRSGVADILVVQHGRIWIIETKVSLTFALIDQAIDRLKHAHWVSIAVPSCRRSKSSYWLLRYHGIGLMRVVNYGHGALRVEESIEPRLNRAGHAGAKKLLATLEPEHMNYAEAGSSAGSQWTPFKRTCRNALEYVQAHGSCSLKDLMGEIKHHYRTSSTARASFAQRIEQGIVPGLRLDRSKRPLLVTLDQKEKR